MGCDSATALSQSSSSPAASGDGDGGGDHRGGGDVGAAVLSLHGSSSLCEGGAAQFGNTCFERGIGSLLWVIVRFVVVIVDCGQVQRWTGWDGRA